MIHRAADVMSNLLWGISLCSDFAHEK